jgi:UDP-N-acetylglucosamine:LPS N-acetylglucosamine transferase
MNYAGGGHGSVANALREQFTAMGHSPEVVNADSFSTANIVKLVTSTYGPMIQYTPGTFKQVFLATNTQRRVKLVNHTNSLLIRPKFLAYLKKKQPDLIVSCQPLYVGSVALLRKHFPGTPFGVVVSDLVNIHPLWFDHQVDFTIVPTEEAEDLALQAGLAPATVERVGLPIRQGFNPNSFTKNQARQELGLPTEQHIIFVGGSGEGAGSIYKITDQLLRETDHHVIAVTGRNGVLFRQLEYLANEAPERLSVYKFVDFIPKLMAASDAIVIKPGPTIISEAMTMRLPAVVLPTPMYQEQGNLDLVKRYKLGQIVASVTEVIPAIEQLLSEPYQGQPYQPIDASHQVAKAIIRLAGK